MTYVSEILAQMTDVLKPQQKAILALLRALMCFNGKATMRNLSRCRTGSPKRLRRWPSQELGWFHNGSRHSTQQLEPRLEMTLIAAVNMDEHSPR